MSCVFTLCGIPCWFWVLALAITGYQAYRGLRFQWLFGIDSARRIAEKAVAAHQAQVDRQARLAQQTEVAQQAILAQQALLAQPPEVVQQAQGPHLSTTCRVILLADFLTYAVCALSGFYALLIAYRVAGLASMTKAPLQSSSVLIFLVVYGVLGITGKLPDTLNRIKGEWKT